MAQNLDGVRMEVQSTTGSRVRRRAETKLCLSRRQSLVRGILGRLGHGLLFVMASSSLLAVLFIFAFIIRDAVPFFRLRGFSEFFTSPHWHPASADSPEFGALAILFDHALVTLCAAMFTVPLGIVAAVCLSDVLPFAIRQIVKPIIEILAAIPSVAFGFFALVILTPLFQNHGGNVLAGALWAVGIPVMLIVTWVLSDILSSKFKVGARKAARWTVAAVLAGIQVALLVYLGGKLSSLVIVSGTNALNVSLVLGIMALPTVVSVSEDALTAVGRELREGSYALGATRAETLVKVVMPAAGSGLFAAAILGIMRAFGETMVVWMAAGNSARIPSPWYNILQPVRTLTATIAGEMGETDQTYGAAHYHSLFAMALCLLIVSFLCNFAAEWFVRRTHKRMGKLAK